MYQVFLDFLLLHSSPKGHLLGVLVLKVLVGLHRTVQLQLLQRCWLGYRLGLLWYWIVCLGNEQRSFCCLWGCTKARHFGLFADSEGYSTFSKWFLPVCMCAKSLHSCLYNPMDCSPPGSSVQGILQARILEWVAISFLRGSSWPRDQTHIFCISCLADRFFTTESPGKPITSSNSDQSMTANHTSLAGYSPWDRKESDMTEWLTHTHTQSYHTRIKPVNLYKAFNLPQFLATISTLIYYQQTFLDILSLWIFVSSKIP